MKPYLTASQYKELLKNMCVIGTTNEKQNQHIIDWFNAKGLLFDSRALRTGDYNFRINARPELGFATDTYFTDELFIERKNSLDELAGSINDESFHYELKRSQNITHKFLLVEEVDGWSKILKHKYQSKYNEKSYWKTLHTFETKYGLNIKFVDKITMGLEIYSICQSVLEQYVIKESV